MWAIRAGSVFDGSAFLTDGATVVLDDGRIAGIEAPGFALPADCPALDHPGILLPGLIDTHTHLVGDSALGALDRVAGYSDDELEAVVRSSLAAQLSAGVTTVRDLGDRRFNVVDRSAQPGEPLVVAAGPPITSLGGHCHYLGGQVSGEAEIRSAIAARVEHGVDVVKVMASGGMLTPGTDQLGSQFSDQDFKVIVDLAHAAGLPVTAHAHALVAVRQALTVGVDGIEHCTCLTAEGPVVDPALIDALADAGIAVCGTAGGDVRELGPPPPHIQVLLDRMGLTADQVLGQRQGFLVQLYRSGVTFTCGVDSGIAPIKAHGSVSASIAVHVEAPIPIAEVLAAATSVSAGVCRLPTKGAIAPGFDADLLLIDGDPRQDVAALSQVAGVVLGGEVVIGPPPAGPDAARP